MRPRTYALPFASGTRLRIVWYKPLTRAEFFMSAAYCATVSEKKLFLPAAPNGVAMRPVIAGVGILTAVGTVPVLFVGFLSGVLDETVAVFVMELLTAGTRI